MVSLQNRFAVLRDHHSTGDGENMQTSSQVSFDKTLSKSYFKFIQAHHMKTITHSLHEHTFPAGMLVQVEKTCTIY